MCYLPYPLEGLLAKLELAAVIIPVTVADNAKSDDFDLLPDIDLTCDFLRIV